MMKILKQYLKSWIPDTKRPKLFKHINLLSFFIALIFFFNRPENYQNTYYIEKILIIYLSWVVFMIIVEKYYKKREP